MLDFLRGKKTFALGWAMIALGVAAVVRPEVAAVLPALGLVGLESNPGVLVFGGLSLIFGRDAMNTVAERIRGNPISDTESQIPTEQDQNTEGE